MINAKNIIKTLFKSKYSSTIASWKNEYIIMYTSLDNMHMVRSNQLVTELRRLDK